MQQEKEIFKAGIGEVFFTNNVKASYQRGYRAGVMVGGFVVFVVGILVILLIF